MVWRGQRVGGSCRVGGSGARAQRSRDSMNPDLGWVGGGCSLSHSPLTPGSLCLGALLVLVQRSRRGAAACGAEERPHRVQREPGPLSGCRCCVGAADPQGTSAYSWPGCRGVPSRSPLLPSHITLGACSPPAPATLAGPSTYTCTWVPPCPAVLPPAPWGFAANPAPAPGGRRRRCGAVGKSGSVGSFTICKVCFGLTGPDPAVRGGCRGPTAPPSPQHSLTRLARAAQALAVWPLHPKARPFPLAHASAGSPHAQAAGRTGAVQTRLTFGSSCRVTPPPPPPVVIVPPASLAPEKLRSF